MNIRAAQRKDIPQIKELLSQVLQIHAEIVPIFLFREPQSIPTQS